MARYILGIRPATYRGRSRPRAALALTVLAVAALPLGSQSPAAAQTTAEEGRVHLRRAGDVNGDGSEDLLVFRTLQQGAGGSMRESYRVEMARVGMWVEMVDGSTGSVLWQREVGDGAQEPLASLAAVRGNFDLNGDDRADVLWVDLGPAPQARLSDSYSNNTITTSPYGWPTTIRALRGDDGTPLWERTERGADRIPPVPDVTVPMPGVADWTGDGIVDFVFARELPWATTYDPYGASRSRRLESVLVSGADGDIFGPAVVATGDGLEPLITTIGDLDGDGIADLVSVDAYAGPSSLAATVTARDGLGGPLWSRYITAPHGFDYGCACFSGTIATAVYPAAIRGDAAGGDLVVGLLSDVNEDWWSQRWGSHRPVAPANLIGLRGDTGQTVFQADPTLPTDFAVGGDIDGDGLADLQTGTIYAPGTCTGAIVDAAWTAGVNEVAWGAQENVECYGNYGGYRLITSTVTYAPGDLDADGVPDHLSMASPSVGTGTWRARSGVDGSLLWEHFYVWSSSGIDSGRLLPLGIDIGGGPGADLLEHDGRPVVLRLRDGALKDELWTATLPELTYVDSAMPDPGFVVADIDRDGTDDLIVAITWGQSPHRNKLYALDGRDGSILWTR